MITASDIPVSYTHLDVYKRQLLNIVNLPERILEGHESIQSCLDMKIDYDSVNVKLDNIRQISFNYLKKALADTKDTDL